MSNLLRLHLSLLLQFPLETCAICICLPYRELRGNDEAKLPTPDPRVQIVCFFQMLALVRARLASVWCLFLGSCMSWPATPLSMGRTVFPTRFTTMMHVRLNRWDTLAKLNFARCDFACTGVNGIIYVAGGFGSGGNNLSSVEAYDPQQNRWTLIESLRRPRWGCFASGLNNKLYIIGTNLAYDSWFQLTPTDLM